jgi:hypothetical protein
MRAGDRGNPGDKREESRRSRDGIGEKRNRCISAGEFLPMILEPTTMASNRTVGYEGNTGHSTGAHLHWAVYFGGSFVNPRLFL